MVNVAGVFTHKAESTQPEIPDVYPNQTVFCLPLSRLGISKKVISSAQSWLSAAPGSFFIYFFIFFATAVKLYRGVFYQTTEEHDLKP